MPNVKITDLTAASTPLAGTELFETVQGGSSKKVAASAIGNSATAVAFATLAGRAYIQAISSVDQTGSVSVATAVRMETTSFGVGISIANDGGGNPTRITFAAAGTYMIAPRLQFANSSGTDFNVNVWFRKNGTDIANSNTIVNVQKLTDGSQQPFETVYYDAVTAGQYIEIMWLPLSAAVTLDFVAAGAIAPATSSVNLAAERIA